jgi:cytoskeletal protein CcmA (bactofilin family)
MKIFGIGSEKENSPDVTSILGKEISLVGNISFKGRFRLDGKVEGNISGEYLILGPTGRVVGDVVAAHLVCQGQVQGKVEAKKVLVTKGGIINGRVETPDLLVESGAQLNGEVRSKAQDLRLLPGSPLPETQPEEKVPQVVKSGGK